MLSLRRIALFVMGIPLMAIIMLHFGVNPAGTMTALDAAQPFVFALGLGLFFFSFRKSIWLLIIFLVVGYLFMKFAVPMLMP